MTRAAATHRRAIAAAAALGVFAGARLARAQLHADVDAEAGVMQRLLTDRPPGGGQPTVGPAFQLLGHVAVLPLLRAGAYVAFDVSPLSGEDARELLSAGLSARLFSPWPRGDFRAFFATGFGYAATRAPAHAAVATESGGFFEVPLGLGATYRLSRSFELIGEIVTRIGFGFSGSMYNQQPMDAGNDSFGVALVFGAAFEL